METPALFGRIVHSIGEYLETDVSHLTMDSRLMSAVPGLDSFKLLEMLLYFEDCFEIKIDEMIIERLETMKDLVDYIESLLVKKSAVV